MTSDWQALIRSLHAAPHQAVLAVTGGGTSALCELLAVPGASRTVIEAVVPYAAASLSDFLGRPPEQFCSETTALAMASVAYHRAAALTVDATDTPPPLVGIGGTAALVSDRPKRGAHRCFVAAQTADRTISTALELTKGARDRAEEDRLVGQIVLCVLAEACGMTDVPPLPLRPEETLVHHREIAPAELAQLWSGQAQLVWSLPDGKLAEALDAPPLGVLCGAFNPLHAGHQALRRVAEKRLGGPVYHELTVTNADKPPLDYLTIARRREQFRDCPLALTNAPTFAEKSAALPGTTFVVGFDTAERILQPRFYGGEAEGVTRALEAIRRAGCRFLVAGRLTRAKFQTAEDLHIPAGFADLFAGLSEDEFREDISSTELRAKAHTS